MSYDHVVKWADGTYLRAMRGEGTVRCYWTRKRSKAMRLPREQAKAIAALWTDHFARVVRLVPKVSK